MDHATTTDVKVTDLKRELTRRGQQMWAWGVARVAAVWRLQTVTDRRLIAAVTLLLVVWMAVLLAELTWTLLPAPASQPVPAAVAMPARSTTASAPSRVMADVSALHLFGKADDMPVVARKPRPKTLKVTRLNLELRGVLASDEPAVARAIIAEPAKAQQAYAVGQTVPGGAILHEIHADHVVLNRSGEFEILRLPKERLDNDNGTSGRGGTAASSRSNRESRTARFDPRIGTNASLGQLRDQLLSNPEQLVGLLQAEPHTNANGEIVGFKIGKSQNLAMLRRFGLRRGDIVTSVNNMRLDGRVNLPELLNSVRNATELRIEFERNGRPRSIVLNMTR